MAQVSSLRPSEPWRRPRSDWPGYNLAVKYDVILYPDEDGWIIAECPAIPGCVSQGKTREEALANIADAIQGCLKVRAERHDSAIG